MYNGGYLWSQVSETHCTWPESGQTSIVPPVYKDRRYLEAGDQGHQSFLPPANIFLPSQLSEESPISVFHLSDVGPKGAILAWFTLHQFSHVLSHWMIVRSQVWWNLYLSYIFLWEGGSMFQIKEDKEYDLENTLALYWLQWLVRLGSLST